jgi:hypothetical protein
LPGDSTETLRTYCRQKTNWIQLSVEATHKMQKYLKFLNFRLDVVVKDICRLTDMAIIADICNGNLDPHKLADTGILTAKNLMVKSQTPLKEITGKIISLASNKNMTAIFSFS